MRRQGLRFLSARRQPWPSAPMPVRRPGPARPMAVSYVLA
jgi:hypothetical protein